MDGMLLRSPRFWLALAPAVMLAAAATGVPTDVLPNPWFTRMTPVRPLDVVVWSVLSLLLGALVATYAVPRACAVSAAARGAGGGVAGVLAIGCPICNKLVVAALGVSGAVTYFAPIQPVLAALAVASAAFALRARLKAFAEPATAASRESPMGVAAGGPA